MTLDVGSRVQLTETALRSFPNKRGVSATVVSAIRRGISRYGPFVRIRFDGEKTVHSWSPALLVSCRQEQP